MVFNLDGVKAVCVLARSLVFSENLKQLNF